MSNNYQNKDSLEEQLKLAFTSNNHDKNYNATKALVSSIPAIGSFAVTFMESYITSPANKRLYDFLDNLLKQLQELKSKINAVDFSTPVFMTTFLQAYQIAIRTHKEQKLEALRNVVLNSSIPSSLDDDLISMFLNWIDAEFTARHLSTLKCLHYLDQYSPEELKAQFPELEKNEAVYNQIIKDLVNRGLINLREQYITEEERQNNYFGFPDVTYYIPQLQNRKKRGMNLKTFKRTEDIKTIVNNSNFAINKSRTTELGKQFIKFIENPSSPSQS